MVSSITWLPLPWSAEALGTSGGVGAAERFWRESVLNSFPNGEGDGLGPLQGPLVAALLVVWLIVFLALAFGKNSFQFLRPVQYSIINELEFIDISTDLYEVEEFSEESHLLRTMSMGNLDFKLFSEARVEQMKGLLLP